MALKRKQAPAKRKRGESRRGTGADAYEVKGKRATARQRAVIDGALEQCEEDRASRRVMIATIMMLTQESRMGEDTRTTGDDDTGLAQQGRPWVSVEDSKKPGPVVHAFLVTGPTSWKKVHGSVKKAPGNLSHAIHKVQANSDPNAYARWEDEATKTVETWLDSGGSDGGGSYPKRYTFTRGERGGQRESSWEAADRLVKEVGAYRWAAGNVFYAVSGDELRRGGPSLMIYGDEGWLRKEPAWSWATRRSISEMSLEVLADRWDVMPGGIVTLHRRLGAMSGKWMVFNVSGTSLDSPDATVVLRRPTALRPEPAHEVAQRSDEGGDGGPRTVERLRSVCKDISNGRSPYLLGGGHGPPVKKLKTTTRFDCSSAVSYALYRAGFFNGDRPAYVSGDFAAKWGKAGKGDEFTVYANAGHCFIEFDNGDRFDTSQHSGDSGPAYTTVKRKDQGRFTARHFEGH